jgi:hypothetical protein
VTPRLTDSDARIELHTYEWLEEWLLDQIVEELIGHKKIENVAGADVDLAECAECGAVPIHVTQVEPANVSEWYRRPCGAWACAGCSVPAPGACDSSSIDKRFKKLFQPALDEYTGGKIDSTELDTRKKAAREQATREKELGCPCGGCGGRHLAEDSLAVSHVGDVMAALVEQHSDTE